MTTIRTSTNHSVEEDVMERAPLQTVDRNVNWYRHCGKQYGSFSKGKIKLTHDREIIFLSICSEMKMKIQIHISLYSLSHVYNSQYMDST